MTQDMQVTQAGLFSRIVTHEQALDAAKNFIDAHFNNPEGKGVLTGVPAREDHDDIVLTDYIKQQRARHRLSQPEQPRPVGEVVVRPCMDRTGHHRVSWDICYRPEPGAIGVGVIASCYGSKEQADKMAAALQTPEPRGDVVELPPFAKAWARYEAKGYQYGTYALEQVEFGYRIASEELAALTQPDTTTKGEGDE